jgi:hypothetical protein
MTRQPFGVMFQIILTALDNIKLKKRAAAA